SRRRQPVAHRSAGLLEINVIERAASQHNIVVSRFHHREVQRLAAQTGLLLLNEVGAGVGLGVGRGPRPGEPLDHGITEAHQLGRHVALAPWAQRHHRIAWGRDRERELCHSETLRQNSPRRPVSRKDTAQLRYQPDSIERARPQWFAAFLADRGTRKPSAHTLKAYRQDFDAIAVLIAGGEDLSAMPLSAIMIEAIRTAFAQYAEPMRRPRFSGAGRTGTCCARSC